MDITEVSWSASAAQPPHDLVVEPLTLKIEDFWPTTYRFGQQVAEKAVEVYFGHGDAWSNLIGDDETECKLDVAVFKPPQAVGIYQVELTRKVHAVATRMTERSLCRSMPSPRC